MKKHKTHKISPQIPTKIVTGINRDKIIGMFKDLNKNLTCENYTFRQDLKTFDGCQAYGFRIYGHDAMFGIQNILSKIQIRGVTFIKCGHGPDQKSEIHIDPEFKGLFIDICTEMGCIYKSDQIPQMHSCINQKTR